MKKHGRVYLLIAILSAFYLLVAYAIGFFARPDFYLTQFAPDSESYLQVSDWLFRGASNLVIQRRTFLYPLLVGLARIPFGNLGIWLMQMLFWLASAVIFFLNLESALPSRRGRYLVFILFCLVLSPIYLSLTVLTESTAFFLFALIGYFFIQSLRGRGEHTLPAVLVCTGCLTMIKPNYNPAFMALLALAPLAKWRGRIRLTWPALALTFAIAFLPTMIQMGFFWHQTSRLGLSSMSKEVIQLTFYPEMVAKLQHRDVLDVRPAIIQANPTMASMLNFALEHPMTAVACLIRNIEENLRDVLHLDADPVWERYWRNVLNDIFYWIHVAFIAPILWLLWHLRAWREFRDISLTMMVILFWIALATTGLAFWAGDRYTVPFLPLWPLIYITVVSRIVAIYRAQTKSMAAGAPP